VVGKVRDLLRARLGLLDEVRLERSLDRHLDARPLLPLPALRRDLVDVGRRPARRVGLLQPLGEQRLQLAHVLEAELQRLEPADGRLREDVAVQGAEGESDVRLREAELDAALLELLGELFQVVAGRRVLVRQRVSAGRRSTETADARRIGGSQQRITAPGVEGCRGGCSGRGLVVLRNMLRLGVMRRMMVVVVVAVQDAGVGRRDGSGGLRERERHVLRPPGRCRRRPVRRPGRGAAVLQNPLVMYAQRRGPDVDRRGLRRRLDVLLRVVVLRTETMVIRLTVRGPRGRRHGSGSHHVRMVERRRRRPGRRKSAEPLVVHVVRERQAVGRRLSDRRRRVVVSSLHGRLLMRVQMRLVMRLRHRLRLVLGDGSQHVVAAETAAGTARRRRRRQSVDVLQRVGGGGRHLSTSGRERCASE